MKELINIVNSKLQAVIDELKSQKDTLEAKVKTVVEDIDNRVEVASQYKENVEKSNNVISELETEIDKLKKDLRELHEKFDSAGFTELLEAGNKEINGKIIEHNTRIAQEQDNIKHYQEEATNLKDELTTLKDSKNNLEVELNNTIVALNFYSKKIDSITIMAIENADKLNELTEEEDDLEDTSTEVDVDVNKVIDGTIFEEIDGIATGGKEISEEELNDILSESKEKEEVKPEVEVKEEPKVEIKEEPKVEEVKEEVVQEEVKEPEQVVEPIVETTIEQTVQEPVDNNEQKFIEQFNENVEPQVFQAPVVEQPITEPTSVNDDIVQTIKELGLDPSLFDESINRIGKIDINNASKIIDVLDTHFIDLNNIYTYPSILVTIKPEVLSEILDTLEFAGCIPSTINYIFKYLDKMELSRLKEKVKGETDSIINVLFDIINGIETSNIGQVLGLTEDEVNIMKTKLDDREYNVMCSFPDIIRTNYNTLKGLHVDNVNKCISEHPKRFMNNPDVFEAILDKYDPQDLVRCINKNVAVIDKL